MGKAEVAAVVAEPALGTGDQQHSSAGVVVGHRTEDAAAAGVEAASREPVTVHGTATECAWHRWGSRSAWGRATAPALAAQTLAADPASRAVSEVSVQEVEAI